MNTLATSLSYKSFLRVFVIALVVFVNSSCALVKDLEVVGVNDYEVIELGLTKIKLRIDLKVNNPNWFKIKVSGGELNVKIDEVDFGNFNITEKVIIPKKKEAVVPVFVETKMTSIFSSGLSSLMSLFTNGGEVPVHFKGHVNAKALGLSKKIEFDEVEKLSLIK